jgi:hypothetical protein
MSVYGAAPHYATSCSFPLLTSGSNVLLSTPFVYSINKSFIYLSETVNKNYVTYIQVLFHSLKMLRTYLLIITGIILSKMYYGFCLLLYIQL